METLWQDIRFGIRMLARKPGFTIVAVLTLALGIGANTAMFTVINGVLLRPLEFPHPDRIVSLSERSASGAMRNVGYLTVMDWRARSQSLEHVAAYRFWMPSIFSEGVPERVTGLRVTRDFFHVLGVAPVLGRDFLPEEDERANRRVAILSHGLWQRRFGGDASVLNSSVILSDREYVVVGILPPDYQPVVSTLSSGAAEIWSPLGYDEAYSDSCRSCRHLRAIGRMADGVSFEQTNAEIETMTAQMAGEYPDDYSGKGAYAVRLLDRVVGSARPALFMLLGAVGFLLLIACANVANLLLVRGSQREKEIAIRAALGAGRKKLIALLMTESALLALAGSAVGVLLALWGVDALLLFGSEFLPRPEGIQVNGAVLVFTVGSALAASILFGVVPALGATRPALSQTLKSGGRSDRSAGNRRLRGFLVVAETALALVLLVGGALLLHSFYRLTQVNPGFESQNLLTMFIQVSGAQFPDDAEGLAYNQDLARRIEALPGVESAGWSSNLPMSGNFDMYGMSVEERPDLVSPNVPYVERYSASGGYLSTMKIPLQQGRWFNSTDRAGTLPVVLVNEALARQFWPGESALGKRIDMGGKIWRTIVGVVGDVRHRGLSQEPTLQAYIPQSQRITYYNHWVIRTQSDPAAMAFAIRDEVWAANPRQTVEDLATMPQLASATIARQKFTMLLLGLFASVALMLAAIGLYGVVSYSVNQRRGEMGIRIALGASKADMLRLVLRQGMGLSAVGVILGALVSFFAVRLLSGFLYGVTATDPFTFTGASALLMTVTLVASYIPARRAARVDPMVALRYE